MDQLPTRLTVLEGLIRTADERLMGMRNQLEQAAQERLLLVGAMLEVRRMLTPEPQPENVTADEMLQVSPGGTD